jgi:hypothetical protein
MTPIVVSPWGCEDSFPVRFVKGGERCRPFAFSSCIGYDEAQEMFPKWSAPEPDWRTDFVMAPRAFFSFH